MLAAAAEALPFADAYFDGAVLGEVLERVEDDLAGLREVTRVVRPSGIIAISVPANPAWFGPSDEWAGHFRRYTRAALLALCAGAGSTSSASARGASRCRASTTATSTSRGSVRGACRADALPAPGGRRPRRRPPDRPPVRRRRAWRARLPRASPLARHLTGVRMLYRP